MLPAQQEAHEVPGRDRLDLAPLALPGVRVDASQHPPGTELLCSVRIGEAAPQREAFVLQADEGEGHVRQRGGPGQVRRRGRTPDVQVAAEHLGRDRLEVHRFCLRASRRDLQVRVQRLQHGLPFGGTPQ